MKSILTLAVAALLLAGIPGADAQAGERSQNPERRGIGLLDHQGVKRLLTTPRTPTVHIDARKSIFVTDYEILRLFSFDETMEALVRQSGSHTLTKEQLYEQWFDTANPIGLFSLPFSGPNCDNRLLNGFPYTCPRDEGQLVLFDPYGPSTPATYTPIALSNRFDLAGDPAQGDSDCGEYRIVFERNSGAFNPTNRQLIIFEAVLPNPHPDGKTLNGCLKVQDFWEDLSRKPVDVRARLLHDFYFKGLAGYEPVVKISHYGSATPKSKGQIRTNDFMQQDPSFPPDVPPAATGHQPWMLREFHLALNGTHLRFEPVTVKTNPIAALLNDQDTTQAQGAAFRTDFLTQVAALAKPGINSFSMSVPDEFDSGQSDESGPNKPGTPPLAEMDYVAAFNTATAFATAISNQIPAGSGLQPIDIVNRALTQTCAGCHHLAVDSPLGGGLPNWPSTIAPPPPAPANLAFTHEQLANPEIGPDGPRYQISPALSNVFLPHRLCVMQAFLQHNQGASCP